MLPAANDCAVNAKDARTATVNHFMADASVKNRPGGRLLLFGFSVVVWSLAAWPLSFGLVFLGGVARHGWHKRKARRRRTRAASAAASAATGL